LIESKTTLFCLTCRFAILDHVLVGLNGPNGKGAQLHADVIFQNLLLEIVLEEKKKNAKETLCDYDHVISVRVFLK